MMYKFHAYSHPNILATHKATLEFTKDSNLSLNGDCIIGVNADFDLEILKRIIKNTESNKNKIVKIKISSINGKLFDEVTAELNAGFNDAHEIVIRKTDFVSKRTFAVKSNKSASDLRRDLISYLRMPDKKIIVELFVD